MKKLLGVLSFACVLAFLPSILLSAQDKPEDMKAAPAEGKAAAEGKATKEARWEGIVVRSNKDDSTLTVRRRGTSVEKTVKYDSSTKWTSQEHGSKKVNDIDASQVNDNDRVICMGTWDKKGMLHATMISKRLTP